MKFTKLVGSMIAANLLAMSGAYATNGMLMEGYGPVGAAMGGASMAYDNGTAAMANNPATLGLMQSGTSRLDLAIGGLHPDVVSKMNGMPDAESGGNAYYMPAIGWARKTGALTYGVGVFAQGGMGTEYGDQSFLGMGSGKNIRTEVSVGNLILPLAFDVTPDLTIGGSMSLVWGGMDLQMAMSSGQMGMLAAGGNLSASGMGAAALPSFMGSANNVGYFNFSNSSDFTGEANSLGWSGKLGVVYKATKQLTLGAVYQSQTHLGDMKASGAQLSMIDNGGTMGGPVGATYTLTGNVAVKDFQFPSVLGFGLAFQATPSLLLVADYKRIDWSSVMKDFRLTFESSDMGGMNMDMSMPQNWKDQNVVSLGAAFKVIPALTLRGGANLANNPVPDDTVNPLFPAIVKNHFTVGAGYAFSNVSEVNASLVYAPNVSVTTPSGITIEHSQTNWQLMYSHRF
jgi:long-chain fatty acid transport protein